MNVSSRRVAHAVAARPPQLARRCLQPPRAVRVAASAIASAAGQVKQLNEKFEIPGQVEFIQGRGGLPTVVLKHACGATAEVVLFGGCITSWKQASGDEVLYIRPDAVFDKSKPISGGVPHCFPQFGPGKMQQHGFARNLDWEVAGTSADSQPDDRDPEVELVLTENDYTRTMWPHSFKVAYTISLHGELLKTDMRVVNTGDSEFDFSAALHTYLEVAGVENARVRGLKGLQYLDKTVDANNPPTKTEDRDEIAFTGPVDSVYLEARDHVELDVGTGAAVAITSNNWSGKCFGSSFVCLFIFFNKKMTKSIVTCVLLTDGKSNAMRSMDWTGIPST